MSKRIICSLDIGTTKIACFVGEQSENGKIRILGYGKTESVGVENGVVRNIRSTASSIRKAVGDAADMAKMDITEVYVGIAGQHIKSRPNQGSIMIPEDHALIEQSDIDHLIDDQYRIMLEPGEEIIHVFPQTYIVDNDKLDIDIDPVGVAGKCLVANFHVVTGNAAQIRNIRDAVKEAGLRVKGVVLEPIASAYAVLDEGDKAAGVALVDIGGGTTDIAIFQDGIIRYTSVLALAGNVITNDIREGCRILKHQAESLKVKFGSCLPNMVSANDIIAIPGIRNQPPREIAVKSLANIIKARMQQILEQVDLEITNSGLRDQLIAGIVLAGGGAKLTNLKEFTEFSIGIDTRLGSPNEHIVDDDKKLFEELGHPMYATGIGLVIYGMLEEQNAENVAAEQALYREGTIVADKSDAKTEPVANQPEEVTPESGKGEDNKSAKNKDGNLSKKITEFITRIFTEDGMDE